jgi:hypothetical protein
MLPVSDSNASFDTSWHESTWQGSEDLAFHCQAEIRLVMEQLPASRTAVRVALQRAVHQLLDDEPRVFIDPVAVGLFPEATEAVIRGQTDQFLQPSWRRIRANFV